MCLNLVLYKTTQPVLWSTKSITKYSNFHCGCVYHLSSPIQWRSDVRQPAYEGMMSHIDLLLNFKYICITWCIVHSFILKATPHAYASQHTSLTCKYKLFDFVLWMLFKVTFLYPPPSFQRIARDRNNPDHWLDYGTFCLYLNDLTKVSTHQRSTVNIQISYVLFYYNCM